MSSTIQVVQADLSMQSSDRYHRVPFTVPEGAPSIGVRISFDREHAVIDLGCEGPNAWRGWSGGARNEFSIEESRATPGYVPGPIEAGEWNVILGLHSLPLGAAEVSVEISVPSEVTIAEEPSVSAPTPTRRGSERNLPAPEGTRWYAGDFHNHTFHSDGKRSIRELAKLGVENGLDFLAVTDHNTVSHHPHLPAVAEEMGITLVPGQEITSHRGHANAYGDIGWIDFRKNLDQWPDEVERRGGVFSINHPIDVDCAWTEPLKNPPTAVELWHASWYLGLRNTGILSWYAALGHPVSLVGGSDYHEDGSPNRPGTPTTWVAASDNTPEAILEAVRAGRTMVTGTAHFSEQGFGVPDLFGVPTLVRLEDNSLIAIDAVGTVFVAFDGTRRPVESADQVFDAPKGGGPYRLVMPDGTTLAMSM